MRWLHASFSRLRQHQPRSGTRVLLAKETVPGITPARSILCISLSLERAASDSSLLVGID